MQLANDRLAFLLPEWHLLLQGWSADGRITAAAQEALLLNGEPQALTDLTKQWAAGVFSALPPIVLLSSADINGAMGAYALSTGTIYLNADWLAGASKEQAFSVLTEELGHHLDGLLNAVDTPGDEGEYFAGLLTGQSLNPAAIEALRQQGDLGTLSANGSSLTAEFASTPVIRGNSLYAVVDGPSWTQAESNSLLLGGHLTQVSSLDENSFVANSFDKNSKLLNGSEYVAWIGVTYDFSGSEWTDVNGQRQQFFNWYPGQPDQNRQELGRVETSIVLSGSTWGIVGVWDDSQELQIPQYFRNGIAEIPIISSITRTGAVKEGAGVFTTSINLSAGTQTSGNLAEGSQVWWRISGITADDLATGALTGNGFITNGKLDIQHSLVIDSDTAEQFTVTVYSDAAMTQQIGTTNLAAVQETSPIIRGNSFYTIVNGLAWTQAEANAVALGGHLTRIDDSNENSFIISSDLANTEPSWGSWIGASDRAQEGIWVDPSGVRLTYLNWYGDEPNNLTWYDANGEDYAAIVLEGNNPNRGTWADIGNVHPSGGVETGIAEIPIISSITRTGAVKEGAGVFTTSINLSAGTQTSGNLAEGSQVWWRISGITADDLATGALTGNGFITNGKLDILHSLVIDADAGEQFSLSVYSDAAMTQQIGTVNTTFIEESDITPPTISSISTQGTTVTLKFSETISALPVSITAFTVATVSSSGQATTRTISTVARDLNDPTKLILTLTGTPPASNVNLRVSYTDPAGAQSTGDVQDLAGNDLANFSRFADTFLTSSTSTLANQYQNLILTLTSNVNGTGNALNNSITGNGANNTLSGLTGADTMAGGLGNDTYIVDNTGDVVTEDLNAGTDTVQSSITYTLGANLENLTLTGSAAINGTGNALNNVLTGNSAANILSGGDGSDTLIGGAGADTLTGSTGADTFRFALADSRFAAFDRITDFTIGTDILDGPTAVTNTNLRELGSVSALTATAIGSVLTTANFARNGAATFSFGSGPTARTFLAVNDGTAGFSSTNDSLIEITGYTGLLTNLAIV